MSRYSKLLVALAALLASAVVAPLPAGAGCPGCEEYTLDIPEEEPAPEPEPEPAPAVGTAPVAPIPAEPVPEAAPAPSVAAPIEEPVKRRRPKDTDPDPVPEGRPSRADLSSVPALAASQASEVGGLGSGGVLPLAVALLAVACLGAILGLRRHPPTADADPPAEHG